MAKLTKEEAEQLRALTEKAKAKDAPPAAGRNLSISIDLGDEAQVKRAISLGLLEDGGGDGDGDGGGGDGDDGDGGDGGGDGDDPPKRRGFFSDE